MTLKTIFLFVILILSLVLFSFLGGNNNEGFTNDTYTGQNGATAQSVTTDQGNTYAIGQGPGGNVATGSNVNGIKSGNIYTNPGTATTNTYTGNNGTTNTYSGVNGATGATYTTNQGNTYAIGKGRRGNVATGSNVNGIKSGNIYTNGNYDNYNHYTGTSYPTIFYGPDGGTARVIQTGNDTTIVTTTKDGQTTIYYVSTDPNQTAINTFYGPNGAVATVVTNDDGKQAISITYSDGSTVVYTEDNTYVYNSQDQTISDTGAYNVNTYYGPNGGQAATVTGPQGNTAGVAQGPGGAVYTGYNTTDGSTTSTEYYNSLPPGIPASQIPAGQEDLYILKSQVVPPVCPVCPEPIVQCPNDFDASKCPPCPPCARCPEPAFDCKKVPNYNAFNPDYMPVPVLNDFSSFGM
jgi:putative hemolysin